MNREFENLDLQREEDKLTSEEIKKEPIVTKRVEDSEIPENKEVIVEKRVRRRDKKFYREEDPIYFENELGKDIYPLEIYAGFFRRFFSFILDLIIGSAVASIFVDGLFSFTGLNVSNTVYGLLKTLFILLYFTISTYMTNGQSLGKMIFGLKVVSLDGNNLTLPQVITREFFGRFIHTYGILFLLYIMTGLTERKQNLSDMFADTSVIDLSKEKAYKIGQIDTTYQGTVEV